MGMKNVTVRLDELVVEILNVAAKEFSGQPASEYVRESLTEALNRLAAENPAFAKRREAIIDDHMAAARSSALKKAGIASNATSNT